MTLEIKRKFKITYQVLKVEIREGGGSEQFLRVYGTIEEAILTMEAEGLREEDGFHLVVRYKEIT